MARWVEKVSEQVDAWSFYQSIGARPRDRLSRTEREVAAICDLRQEVNSGGFDSYFRSWGGDSAGVALVCLPTVLGQEWADVLAAAMSLLGPVYPDDGDVRAELIERLGVSSDLDALDERYFDLEASADADALVSAHLVGNPGCDPSTTGR